MKLFCISKRFHHLVSSHLTSYILSAARRWAPISSRYLDPLHPAMPGTYSTVDITTLLPFHNYLHLCTFDPVGRTIHASNVGAIIKIKEDVLKAKKTEARHQTTLQRLSSKFVARPVEQNPQTRYVPTFRYLFFVHHRSLTIRSILRSMWLHGHRLPVSTPGILIKLWYTMDLPTTALRAALFRNERYWSDTDLRTFLLICMKLDMVFSDPVDGRGEIALRQMMLAQRTLSTLDDTLARRDCRNSLETMRHYVRWKYVLPPGQEGCSIMGIPPEEIGCLEKEGWGTEPQTREGVHRLFRPDELASIEALKRGIDVRKDFVPNLISGYINPLTLKDLPTGFGFGSGVDAGSAPHI